MGDLAKEFFQTKERTAAWLFRILITVAGFTTTSLLYVAWGTLQDVKIAQSANIQQVWTTISKINDTQSAANNNLAVLQTTVKDHIQVENDIDNQLKDVTKDHEGRIRTLEHPH